MSIAEAIETFNRKKELTNEFSVSPFFPPRNHNELLIHNLHEALILAQADPVLSQKLYDCIQMSQGLEDYLGKCCPEESELQKKMFLATMTEPWEEHSKNQTAMFPFPRMISANLTTQFMKLIVEIGKYESVLEIGMFTGYGTATLCSSKFVKKMVTLEVDPFSVNFVQERFAGTEEGKKLRVIQGPALESLKKLKENGETFDVVYIDADKPNYINYYKEVMDNDLIKSGGVFLFDNSLWQAELYPQPHGEYGQVFVELNDFVQKDERVEQVIIQVDDGVSIIRRK